MLAVMPLSNIDNVVEIGSGQGLFSSLIAQKVKKIISWEIDRNLVNYCSNTYKNITNLTFLENDALNSNWGQCFNDYGFATKLFWLIGNLPYNISSQIILKMLVENHYFQGAFFCLQKEVGERLTALPTDKKYNAFSAIVQHHFTVKKVMSLPKTYFYPVPKVDSVLISFISDNPIKYDQSFHIFLKALYKQPRKTLLNNLEKLFSSKKITEQFLSSLHYEKLTRMNDLSLQDTKKLYQQYLIYNCKTIKKR